MINSLPENPKKNPESPKDFGERLRLAAKMDPKASLEKIQMVLKEKNDKTERLRSMIPSNDARGLEQFSVAKQSVERRLLLSQEIKKG